MRFLSIFPTRSSNKQKEPKDSSSLIEPLLNRSQDLWECWVQHSLLWASSSDHVTGPWSSSKCWRMLTYFNIQKGFKYLHGSILDPSSYQPSLGPRFLCHIALSYLSLHSTSWGSVACRRETALWVWTSPSPEPNIGQHDQPFESIWAILSLNEEFEWSNKVGTGERLTCTPLCTRHIDDSDSIHSASSTIAHCLGRHIETQCWPTWSNVIS
jgi:hypothetical protein